MGLSKKHCALGTNTTRHQNAWYHAHKDAFIDVMIKRPYIRPYLITAEVDIPRILRAHDLSDKRARHDDDDGDGDNLSITVSE